MRKYLHATNILELISITDQCFCAKHTPNPTVNIDQYFFYLMQTLISIPISYKAHFGTVGKGIAYFYFVEYSESITFVAGALSRPNFIETAKT